MIKGDNDMDTLKNEMGILSQNIVDMRENELTPEDIRNNFAEKVNDYCRTQQILRGIVCGASELGGVTVAKVEFDEFEIYIREQDFFMPGYSFGNEYEGLEEHVKAARRRAELNRFAGAEIPFVIVGFMNGEEVSKDYNLIEGLYIFGSRVKAMMILQDIYYYHKNRSEDAIGTPRQLEVNALVESHVLMEKGPNRILVEFCGAETLLNEATLPFNKNTGRCQRFFPGDKVTVRVQKIYDKEGELRVLGTARINNPFADIDKIKVHDTYLGFVTSYSIDHTSYNIMLKNGCMCTVKKHNVKNGAILALNDKVLVTIIRVAADAGFVVGEAKKLRH